ncbi:MAG: hypothetical protein PW786_03190 [Arachidicoccus sp.]|nr:hypothetical protein [Arachidicoccus sp.]
MKKRFIFLLLLMIVCGNVFSQTRKEIDSFPYIFAVNNNQFRIKQIHIEATDSTNSYYKFIVTKYNSDFRDTIEYADGQAWFNDVNNDSFPDIVFSFKDEAYISLFNPVKNTFVNSGPFHLNLDSADNFFVSIKQIDKKNNLYCDYIEATLRRNYSSRSYLFQIINYERKNLMYMDIEREYANDGYETTGTLIYKYNSIDGTDDKLIETINSINKSDLIKSNN